ncbi:Hypothetical predicted protein [Marmota monax]|uniref:Uncharacterized protein n=1 Tax=Marmota monax TaxID=9995 RepID=A0A5E4D6I2_MARMO|nr:Hypothetical predicted protein [Marmota monax]
MAPGFFVPGNTCAVGVADHPTPLSGKWNQGVRCASRGDHCHHPLNHGFDYFYRLPFTLVNDCDPNRPPELWVTVTARFSCYACVLAMGVLTLAATKLSGLLLVPWTRVGGPASLLFLFFTTWFSSCWFLRCWKLYAHAEPPGHQAAHGCGEHHQTDAAGSHGLHPKVGTLTMWGEPDSEP